MKTLDWIAGAQVYDLAQPYFVGMPHHPAHPPFLFSLVKSHGEYVGPAGNSSASDAIADGQPCRNAHRCALPFFVRRQAVWRRGGGVRAVVRRRPGAPLDRHHSADLSARRAARFCGGGILPNDREITPEDLQAAAKVEIRQGDIVLLRTGWAAYFPDPRKFISEVRGPGPAIAGARWLSERGVFAAGSDTVAFENVPDPAMPVHVHLLVENGIHIIECLNLESLAAAGVHEFLFVALPLKIRGATASPVRPIAIVEAA